MCDEFTDCAKQLLHNINCIEDKIAENQDIIKSIDSEEIIDNVEFFLKNIKCAKYTVILRDKIMLKNKIIKDITKTLKCVEIDDEYCCQIQMKYKHQYEIHVSNYFQKYDEHELNDFAVTIVVVNKKLKEKTFGIVNKTEIWCSETVEKNIENFWKSTDFQNIKLKYVKNFIFNLITTVSNFVGINPEYYSDPFNDYVV